MRTSKSTWVRDSDSAGKRQWWVLFNVTLVNLLGGGIAWSYIVTVVPEVLRDLGREIGDWGVLWSGIAFGVLVFSVPAGALGDRFGVRRVVGCGLAFGGAALLLRAAADSFAWMLLSMVLFGMALALLAANLPKTLGLWFQPAKLGMANGVSLAGFGFGQGIAVFATPRVLPLFGTWQRLTAILAGMMVALAIYWLVAVPDRSARSRDGQCRPPAPGSIAELIRVSDLWLVALCYLFYFGGHLGVFGYLPTYFATVQGMSPQAAGLIVSLGAWFYILGSVLLPTLSDRIGLRKIVFVTAICVNGIAVFTEAYLLGVPLAVASIIWGISAGAVGLVFVVPIEMEGVGPARAGTAVGIVMGAGFLGGVLSPLIGLRLSETHPVQGFAFFSSCYLMSALLFAMIRETGRRRRIPDAESPIQVD